MNINKNPNLVNPMIIDAPMKDNEQKVYVILYYQITEDDEEQRFTICNGRTQAYDFIKINAFQLNIHDSIVLVETRQVGIEYGEKKYFLTNISDAKSVYEFCKFVQDMYDDGFNIEDYNDRPNPTPEETNYKINTTSSEAMAIWQQVFSNPQQDNCIDNNNIVTGDPDDITYNI